MKIPKAKKLPSGSWFIHLRLCGENIPVTASTQKECVRLATLIKAEHKAGVRQAKSKDERTVRQICEDYIATRREKNRSPATIRGYHTIMASRFQGVMDKPVSSVKDWETVVRDELDVDVRTRSKKEPKPGDPEPERKKVSRKTVKNAWGFLSSALRAAKISVPEIAIDGAAGEERPWLDYEQIQTFLQAIRGDGCELGALLALHSLRRSEIHALTWSDIDLRRSVIHVRGAVVLDEQGQRVEKAENKTRDSRRDVPILIPRLAELLREEQKKNPVGYLLDENINKLYKRVVRICAENGLPKAGVHGLRHSFASLAYHVGMGELETMQLGGWSDPGTMRKIYRHLAAQDKNAAAAKMAAFYAAIENANENANEFKKF